MLDFRFIKEDVEVRDIEEGGKIHFKRLFHASSYQGGILLRTTTLFKHHDTRSRTYKQMSENIINLPMAEIYEIEKGKLDIRMVTFDLQKIGMDIGIDIGGTQQ